METSSAPPLAGESPRDILAQGGEIDFERPPAEHAHNDADTAVEDSSAIELHAGLETDGDLAPASKADGRSGRVPAQLH